MGVEGLWKAIDAAAEHVSLRTFSINEAADRKRKGIRRQILGIDISSVMGECTAATKAAGIHGQFYGGALRIFFTKLGMYLRLPVTLVFVFDGPERPDIKRGRHVVHRVPYWVDIVKEMVMHFGYYSHQAPGEAEAELAQLNHHGYIDGIITSDSDSLVFGALRVFKTIPKRDRKYDYETVLYMQEVIEATKGVELTKAGLILYALLAGGDYGAGVSGCGAAVAVGLAQCGFGDQLLDAIDKPSHQSLHHSLDILRQDIRNELATNSQKKLGSRYIALSRSTALDKFPDLQLVNYYYKPATTFSIGQGIPDLSKWRVREPSISNIATLCSTHLGTKTEDALKDLMRSHIWEGVFAQMLYSPYVLYDSSRKLLATPNTQAPVITAVEKMRHLQKLPDGNENSLEPRITISVMNFVQLIGRNFATDNLKPLILWSAKEFIPSGMIQQSLKRKRSHKEKSIKIEPGLASNRKHLQKSKVSMDPPIEEPSGSNGKAAQHNLSILDTLDTLFSPERTQNESMVMRGNPQSTARDSRDFQDILNAIGSPPCIANEGVVDSAAEGASTSGYSGLASTSREVIELTDSDSEGGILTSTPQEIIELTDSDSEEVACIDLTHLA